MQYLESIKGMLDFSNLRAKLPSLQGDGELTHNDPEEWN